MAKRERELDTERARHNIRVVGDGRVLSVHCDDMPKSEEMFSRNPTFSAETREQRVVLAAAYKAFVRAYYVARDAYYAAKAAAGEKVIFPAGTYRLRVLHGVACACP